MSRPLARSRLLVALLLSLMVALPLGAGGFASGAHAQEKTKITFWNYWDGENGRAIQKLVDQYNADHPNVQVENVFLGFNDLLPKLQAAASGGDAPDVSDVCLVPQLYNARRFDVSLDAFPKLLRADAAMIGLDAVAAAHPDRARPPAGS